MDDDQFEMLNQYSWYTHSNGYAMTHIDKQLTSMHRLLTNCPKEMQVDHINCQTNDNRIVNLRICTKSQNEGNKRKMKGKSTEYKGVTERNGSYEVTIKDANNNSEYVYIGRYSNKVAAANMYNHFAKRIFGEFARLNEVPYMSPDECKLYKGEKENTSLFRGVCWSNKNKAWRCRIFFNGKEKHIGIFDCEKSAANAYNKYALECLGEKAILNDVEYIPENEWIYSKKKQKEKSKYLGVSLRHDGKWRSRVFVDGEDILIGTYDNELDAANARDKFVIDKKLNRKLNFDKRDEVNEIAQNASTEL